MVEIIDNKYFRYTALSILDLISPILFFSIIYFDKSLFENLFGDNNINTLLTFYLFIFIFLFSDIYSFKNRLFSFNFFIKFIILVILNFLIQVIIIYFDFINIPFSIIFFFNIFLFSYCVSLRILIAYLLIYMFSNKTKCIIYGAGSIGMELSVRLNNFSIIGFLDDDLKKLNSKINGIKIYHIDRLDKILEKTKISYIFIAIKNLESVNLIKLLDITKKYKINIKILPSVDQLINKKLEINNFREVDVKDLLNRNINFRYEIIESYINNKIILISGAGGSIGSELTIQILTLKPKKIILVDSSEENLYHIINKCVVTNLHVEIKPILLDIYDYDLLRKIFKENLPSIVFHTAAYKHVPIIENNIFPAIKNNIFGTFNLVNISNEFQIDRFIHVSSDKAVRPTNIMGATKRFCEKIILSFANQEDIKTKFSIVRFGNVLASSGSVVKLFNQQIKNGGPVTVTDEKISRYFMSIKEACFLILESGADNKGGQIFVLNMGNPIKIIDLAKKMIQISKINNNFEFENQEIKIVFTGLRPGEKIEEELFINKGMINKYNENIFIEMEKLEDLNEILNKIQLLKSSYVELNHKKVIDVLKNSVEDFINISSKYDL